MKIDRIQEKDTNFIVSIDKTKYRNTDPKLLSNWYAHQFSTMRLIEVTDDEGYINYILDGDGLHNFDHSAYTILEKLRSAYCLIKFEKLVKSGYIVDLSDENLFIDNDKSIVLMFAPKRDLYMEPEQSDFIAELKARILSMFSKYSYTQILESNFTLQFKTSFEAEILACQSIDELRSLLTKYIDEKNQEQTTKFVVVQRKTHSIYRIMTFAFLIAFLISFGGYIYTMQFKVPELTSANELLSLYIERDYASVISTSKEIDLDKQQKYIVGYSSIMSSSLNEKKRKVILSTFTPDASESMLDYWVAIGYGNYLDASSKGKTINDDEYVLYALRLEENRLVTNDKIDGSEKEQQLTDVRAEIKTYEEKLAESSKSGAANE